MQNSKTYLLPLARLLMCSLFIWDGVLQLRNPGGTAQYFASLGVPVPDVAIWVSIAIHLLGGLAILVGFKTR
jgi:putative oxidoreductase